MTTRAWVIRDPARHDEILALLRAAPRVLVNDLSERMGLSRSCVRNLLDLLRHQGKVDMAIDITMRTAPRAGSPLVAWIVTAQTKRLGKRLKPRPLGFTKRATGAYVYPYAPSGTPAHLAGRIQVMACNGVSLQGTAA